MESWWKFKYPALNVVRDHFSGSEYLDECGDNVGISWVMITSSELTIAIRDSLRQGNTQLVDKGGANISAHRGPFFVLLGCDVRLTTLLDANLWNKMGTDVSMYLRKRQTSPKIWMVVDFKRYRKFHP